MWHLSADARHVLRGSHAITARATAYTPLGPLPDLPIVSGEITNDSKSQVRRSGRLEIGDPALWPATPVSPLSPIASEVAVEYGIVIPRVGVEWVPVIRGPIQSARDRQPPTDGITIAVADRSAGVAQDRLDRPTQTDSGATFLEEITRLIQESQPDAEVVVEGNVADRAAPRLTIDTERWAEGIEKLADGLAAEVYADAAGRYVIRPQPTLDDPPVWTVDAGETGVLIAVERELTRERVYNAVVARGERLDGTAPVWAKVVDDDVASPTYYGGPFGRRVRYYASPLLTTVEQCEKTARALLERAKGYVATVQVEQVVNPALEAGDVLEVVLPDGAVQRHIIDAVPVPLGNPAATQKLTTRSIDVLPAESGLTEG